MVCASAKFKCCLGCSILDCVLAMLCCQVCSRAIACIYCQFKSAAAVDSRHACIHTASLRSKACIDCNGCCPPFGIDTLWLQCPLTHPWLQEDESLTRSNAYLLQLFSRSRMQVLLNVQQRRFPKDLFKVRMYVIRPEAWKHTHFVTYSIHAWFLPNSLHFMLIGCHECNAMYLHQVQTIDDTLVNAKNQSAIGSADAFVNAPARVSQNGRTFYIKSGIERRSLVLYEVSLT